MTRPKAKRSHSNRPSIPERSEGDRVSEVHDSVAPQAGGVQAGRPTEDERRRLIALAAYYRAERRGFAPGCELDDWLDPFRRFWEQRLDSLATELARTKRERRLRAGTSDPAKETTR